MKTIHQILFFSTLLFFASCEETKPTDEASDILAQTDPPVSDCSTAPASWFAEVNNTRLTPAPNEGDSSVFANSVTVTNCDFHRWSWQKFLYLTNETNGVPYFQTELTQVGPDGTKLGKGGAIILEDTAQASDSTDILKTNTNASTSDNTVYYSIMINDIFDSTMTKYGKMAHENIESIKDIAFPVGALETKSSWIKTSALGGDSSSYYITNGKISGVPARVALLGIHVVGVVKNHPEFVWATFEHDDLAPAYPWSDATHTTDATVTSPGKSYPFFDSTASATVKNISSGNGIYTDIFSLYEFGVPVEINANEEKVFTETCQDGEQNYDNITAINKSVKSQLQGIWNNYYYNGSLWVNMEYFDTPDAQATLLNAMSNDMNLATVGKLIRGSVSAYNITMETYVQAGGFDSPNIHDIKVQDYVNCFFCHSAQHNNQVSPLQISHVFNGYVSNMKGLTKAQIKEEHVTRIRAKSIRQAIGN